MTLHEHVRGTIGDLAVDPPMRPQRAPFVDHDIANVAIAGGVLEHSQIDRVDRLDIGDAGSGPAPTTRRESTHSTTMRNERRQ